MKKYKVAYKGSNLATALLQKLGYIAGDCSTYTVEETLRGHIWAIRNAIRWLLISQLLWEGTDSERQ